MTLKSFFHIVTSKVTFLWNCIPYKFMLALILISLKLNENYPISDFPMYSSFSSSNFWVYLTDSQDQVISINQFGLHAANLKKMYAKRYVEINGKRTRNYLDQDKVIASKAGNELLNFIIETKANSFKKSDVITFNKDQTLKLWYSSVSLKEDKLIRKTELIAEVKLR